MDMVASMSHVFWFVNEAELNYELEKRIILDQLADDVRCVINRRGVRSLKKYWAKRGFSFHLNGWYDSWQIALIEENRMFFSIWVAQSVSELMGVCVDAAFIKLPLHPDSDGLVYIFRIERSYYRI